MKVSTRLGAFGIHLLISVLILLVLLAVVFFVWYPHQLIYAGGIDGLKILMGVDLVLGPLLTFIVFVPNKKGLKLDLTLIGVVQFVCLALGMWMIYSQRPLVQVLMDDGVHLLSASDVEQNAINHSAIKGHYPKHVMMDFPDDKSSWGNVKLMTELADGKPYSFRDDLYLPIIDLDQQRYQKRIEHILEDYSNEELQHLNIQEQSNCTWIPITSIHVSGYACHSYENGIEELSDHQL
jgi:hypothetical protein